MRLLAFASPALLAFGCATTQPATTSTATRPSALAAQPASADDDVSVLKERVSRLERRLADVDAKLGLLLAQRSSPRAQARSVPAESLGPRELIEDSAPKEEASLGARAIDLSTRKSAYEDPPEPAVKPDEDNGPPIVIKVVGDAPRDTVVERPGEKLVASTKQVRAPESTTQLEEPVGLSVRDQYDWAQARMKEGKLDDAVRVFEEIATRHSHHDLADNAIYWIAFCKQEKGDHRGAVDTWQKLPMRFPKSPKIPDALYGMAVSEEALGEPAVAETLYEQLVSQYPRAEKVHEAKRALERLRPR